MPIEDNETPNELDILQGDESDESSSSNEPDDSADVADPEDSQEPDEDSSEDEEQEDSEEDDEEDSEADKDEDDEPADDERIGIYKTRPTFGQLRGKYPNIFKDFPDLRNVIARETEFSKRFPNLQDADEILQQVENYQVIEKKLETGDPQQFLDMLGNFNQNTQRKFIADFLPTLHKNNRNAFLAITDPIFKSAFRSAITAAKQSGNTDLEASALNMHKFIFGDENIEAGVKKPTVDPSIEEERAQLEAEKKRIFQTRHTEFIESVRVSADRDIDRVIFKALGDDLSDYQRKAITRDVKESLAKDLRDDNPHTKLMSTLVERASKAGYGKEWKDRIQSAYLSRAKVALPGIIKKVKSEALKGFAPRKTIPNRATGTRTNSGSGNSGGKKFSDTDVKTGKVSELDYLKS